MTDFRATEDIQADLRRFDPGFTQFTSASQLLNIGQILDGSTSGPTIFNLGVINEQDPNSEWQGVVRFLNSRLVTPQVRRELQQLQRDLQAAYTDHDGIVNNQELVAYAQAHTDRWPNVVTFRSAADLLLNRLPGYLAQPNLNQDQVAHLWGVMNQLAREWNQVGADPSQRGLVYGLPLTGFPSTDQNNPPDLIRRALRGELDPDE